MSVHYIATLTTAAILSLSLAAVLPQSASAELQLNSQTDSQTTAQANPCTSVNPCAGKANPCAGANASAPLVYSDTAGLAIRGTDPVAYFTEGKPVQGSSQYEQEWNGATWRFSSAANRALFVSNPEAYAPQYGGYCAQALSEGNVVSTDPNAWKIVGNKLYLNYSPAVQQQWMQDIPGRIAQADARWPKVLVGATVFQ